jgi:Arc/MetJ family transcription regulator
MVYSSRLDRYIGMIRKTTIEVDEHLFERTRDVLGTKGLKATVQRAFEQVPVPPNEDEDLWVVEGIKWAKENLAEFLGSLAETPKIILKELGKYRPPRRSPAGGN